MNSSKLHISDRLIAIFLALIVFMAVLSTMGNNCPWGDDFAAYINEAIAIANGSFDEQISINSFMHPSTLSSEGIGTDLVYVWGYPLILALVYKLVGYDTLSFQSIIYYKVPSLLALSLLSALMYYFFRRRFNKSASLALSALLCLHPCYIEAVNYVYSDIVFLFFSWLSLYLAELMTDRLDTPKPLVPAILLGVSLWATYAIRLNGSSIVATAALIQLLAILRKRCRDMKAIGFQLLPYALALVLTFIFNNFVFATPTSNISDVGAIDFETFKNNLSLYTLALRYFLFYLPGIIYPSGFEAKLLFVFVPLLLIGLIRSFKRELPYVLFLFGTYIILLLLPYNQGMRYCFGIFPVLLMLLGYCAKWFWELLKRFVPKSVRPAGIIAPVLSLFILCSATYSNLSGEFFRFLTQTPTTYEDNGSRAYSDSAKEIYSYIQANTDGDSVIAFQKPRVLYLNTGRLAFNPTVNGHSLDEADYYLECHYFDNSGEAAMISDYDGQLALIYSNANFNLYSITKAQ